MASGFTPSIFDSSTEIRNGTKLVRLIVDGGTKALRQTFTRYHAGDLQVVLSTFKPTLSGLKGKHIKPKQWDKLYPAPPEKPNINDFDITLMCILLRNICGLSPPYLPVWENKPCVSDHSVEADIVRIRLFRNERFGHIPKTAVSLAEFKTYWAEVSSPLVRLGIDQREIDSLEHQECGIEETDRVLKQWNECESKIIASIDRLKHKLDKSFQKQELESESILNKQLVYFDFQPEIEFYYEKCTEGTRKWVFEQIFTWFHDESSNNRAFVISAVAGMGKSVIAAVICKKLAEHVGACHFFQYNNCRYSNPNSLLQSLASQLCRVIPAFKEALIKKLSGNLGQSLNDMNAEGLFSLLFKEPFSSIAGNGKCFLIVLDAVDESEHEGRQDLVNLIVNHFHKLPSYIRFLITTRPENNVNEMFGKLNPLFIHAHDERNLSDIRLVLEKQISCKGGLTEDIIDRLAEQADGLMLYAFFLSKSCEDESSVDGIENFPQDLGEFYKNYFGRLKRELKDYLDISEDTFLSFLGALSVAGEPLPQAFIGSMFGFDTSSTSTKTDVKNALDVLSSLLVVNKNKSISFFHKSIRDWLVDKSKLGYIMVDEQHGHKILLDLCVHELNVLKETYVKDVAEVGVGLQYALKYYIPHMLNGTENKDKLEYFAKNFVADLQVMFACVCINVDLTLINVSNLMNHELYGHVSENTRIDVSELFFLVKRYSFLLRDYPKSFLQHAVNECDRKVSPKASHLLRTRYKNIAFLELIEKNRNKETAELRCLLSGTITGIDVSAKYDYVVCSYKEGGIELFSLVTGKSEWKIYDFMVEQELSVLQTFLLGCPLMLPHCIVFFPHKDLILPGRLDLAITLTGEFMKSDLFQCCDNDKKFTNCCFSKDGMRLVTTYRLDLIVWNAEKGEKETSLQCSSQLVTFSFTSSGRYLGTTNVDSVFTVYDVMSKYTIVKSVAITSDQPVEIVSSFEENSWCCYVNRFLAIFNHLGDSSRVSVPRIILPCNLYSCELQCFFQYKNQTWFSKMMKIMGSPTSFLRSCVRMYILIQNENVLVFKRHSGALHVYSIKKLLKAKEMALKTYLLVITDISANGKLLYFNDRYSKEITVRAVESNFSKSFRYPEQAGGLDILVVKNGVILFGQNLIPTLWNCDVTKRLETFHVLAGTKDHLSVSEELIACVHQSCIIFFDVVDKKIVFRMTRITNIIEVFACSIKYHVLAQIKSGGICLWKCGEKVDGWADVASNYVRQMSLNSFTFSPDGTRLAIGNSDNCFIFDVIGMSIKFHVQIPSISNHGLTRMKFFNNEYLLYCSRDVLYLINAGNSEILTCLSFDDFPERLSVSRERSVVCIGHFTSKNVELIKVCLPRTL